MKKLLLFIPAILLFFSCGKDEIYEGAKVYTQYVTISPENWAWTIYGRTSEGDDLGFASTSFNMPQITQQVINKGAILCYLVGEYDAMLPAIVTDIDNLGYIYTNTISFDVKPGRIRFISENSDLIISAPADPIQIKIVIIQNP